MVLSGKCEFLNMKIQNFQIQSFSLGARDGYLLNPFFTKGWPLQFVNQTKYI